MTDRPLCQRCRADLDGTSQLCPQCRIKVRDALVELPSVLVELERTAARMDAIVQPAHRGEPEPEPWVRDPAYALYPWPAPVNLTAVDLLRDVRGKLGGWVKALSATHNLSNGLPVRGTPEGPVCAGHAHDRRRGGCMWFDDCRVPQHCRHKSCAAVRAGAVHVRHAGVSDWLGAHLDAVCRDADAGRIASGVLSSLRRAEMAIDRRTSDRYLGPCVADGVRTVLDDDGTILVVLEGQCSTDLYAMTGDAAVECPACGFVYSVAEREATLLEAVAEQWASPKVIADALTSMDRPLNASTLRSWIARDRVLHDAGRVRPDGLPLILQVGIGDSGEPLFLVGDVIARLEGARVEAVA